MIAIERNVKDRNTRTAEREAITEDIYPDEFTAVHEAGHAIVGAWLKLPLIHVTAAPDAARGGHAYCGSTAEMLRHDPFDVAISYAAGKAATDLYDRERNWETSFATDDLAQISWHGIRVGCSNLPDDPAEYQEQGFFCPVVVPEFAPYVLRCATDILRIPYVWAAVEWLADVLNNVAADAECGAGDGVIHAKEVRRILRACKKRAGVA